MMMQRLFFASYKFIVDLLFQLNEFRQLLMALLLLQLLMYLLILRVLQIELMMLLPTCS